MRRGAYQKLTVLGETFEIVKDYDDFSDALKAETRDVVKDYVKQNKVELVAQAITDRMTGIRREGHVDIFAKSAKDARPPRRGLSRPSLPTPGSSAPALFKGAQPTGKPSGIFPAARGLAAKAGKYLEKKAGIQE